MGDTRRLAAVAGLGGGLLLSAVVWWYFGTLFVFLVIPFVPFLFGRESSTTVRTCPQCGFRTDDGSYEYCPRDGRRLEESRE